jgi:hypothetical protein
MNPTSQSSPTPPILYGSDLPMHTTGDALTRAILAVIQGYGYADNEGMARRQQRALTLVLQNHFTAINLTINAEGLPVVTRFRVQSGSVEGHYYVTRTPNQPERYDCTCPDTWMPHTCKHRFGASLIQTGLALTHTHRLDLPAYRDSLQSLATLPHATPLGSHERAALAVLLNTAETYLPLAREAARQHYTATRSYASLCFSAMVDKARWAFGAGYVGWADGTIGELHSVMAGRPVMAVRWETNELRWFVAGAEGEEDREATATLLAAERPVWGSPPPPEAEPVAAATFDQEEEPDGHYALYANVS